MEKMQLTINEKSQELVFGVEALEFLDNKYKMEQGGMELGMSIAYVLTNFATGNVSMLSDLIEAGTRVNKPKPTRKEINEYIVSLDLDDLEKLYDDIYENFTAQPVVALQMKRLNQA